MLQLHLWIHIYVVPFQGPLHLWLQSHISLMLDDEGSTLSLDPSPVLFIPILFALYLHKPYIFIFQVQFWKPWLTIWNLLFYVDFSKKKYICVHTHYYWSIPFSAVKSIFYNFFTCMPDICSWSTSYTFLQVQPSKDFITIWYLIEVYFLGWAMVQLHLWIHIYVVPFKGPLHLWLQSHICLTLDDGG